MKDVASSRPSFCAVMRGTGVREKDVLGPSGTLLTILTYGMFDKYNKIDLEGTRQAVGRMEVYLANVDQTVDQNGSVKNESL